MGAELGRGHFARVVECYDTEHGGTYAMKIIDKKELIASQTVVKEEINILRAVGQHKYIVSLLDVYEDNDDYFLIMDLCKGGDLFSKIVEEVSARTTPKSMLGPRVCTTDSLQKI